MSSTPPPSGGMNIQEALSKAYAHGNAGQVDQAEMLAQRVLPPTVPRGVEQPVRPLINTGRYEEAEALLRPYLVGGRGPLGLWKLLAAALRQQGRIAETRAIQAMLVEHAPGDFPSRFELSETLLLLGEFAPDWRWLMGRTDRPWYPATRLFRQPKRGDWESVMASVGEELKRLPARER